MADWSGLSEEQLDELAYDLTKPFDQLFLEALEAVQLDDLYRRIDQACADTGLTPGQTAA